MLYEVLVVGTNVREDAAASRRGSLDHAYVAQGGEAHLHGAWDRGRRQREDVHRGLVFFDALFVPDTEALLLVNDDEPEVFGPDLRPEQRVRPDEHVHLPGRKIGQDPAPLGRQGEAREALDPDGVGAEPLTEGPLVLLDEDGRRGEHHGLLAGERGLEGGPYGYLRLAEANVTADQTVHRIRPLHIRLDGGYGRLLIWGLLEREALLELLLPLPVLGESEAGGRGPRRVKPQELAGQRLDPLADPVGNLRPRRAAELVEARTVASYVLVQQLHLLVGHEERVAPPVAHPHVVPGGAEDLLGHEPLEAPDTLHRVYDQVSDLQIRERGERAAARTAMRLAPAPEQRVPPEDRDPAARVSETLLDLAGQSV